MDENNRESDGVVQGFSPAESLDLCGFRPGQAALVLLENAIDRLNEAAVLEVRLTHAGLREDVAAWARLAGHTLVADAEAGSERRLFLQRKTGSRPQVHDWGVRLPARPDGSRDLRGWLQGRFGELLEEAPTYLGFLPRGSVPAAGTPFYPYTLNRRSDVWAENLPDLYEQAKAQQWNATTDIEWSALPELPEPIERAVCQLMTFLAENEFAALYIPAKFLPRINAQFIEPVLFLASVINDEARHIEAFVKRAFANGGALQYGAALTAWSLHSLLIQEDYFRSTFLLHVLGEGTFLDLLEFIEQHAPDAVTADVVRRARLDEGRHVAYGIAHVRDVLRREPEKAEALVAAAEERSAVLQATSGANPHVIEALARLAAHGTSAADLERGFEAVGELYREMDASRVRRLLQIGLDARTASKISGLHTPNFM